MKATYCPHCNVTFRTPGALTRHIERISRPFSCPQEGCTFRGASNRDLKRHLASNVHPESSAAVLFCPVAGCKYARTSGKGFSRRDHLKRHVRTRHPGIHQRGSSSSQPEGNGSASCGDSDDL
ncbi:hypothetical protein B0T16DRAFT_417708 [Cercophora newfieldiana]|uniref:C2H2-type domain-containing protein n=1 Tax=Cercophora newfieldiana TaxID=92897 RepID=A0AA40CP46_9PEZI|nr:hypothetical protein B0T16DRAFT_417708 [Cercophora newfieldiana]